MRSDKAEAVKEKFAPDTAVTWNDGHGIPHFGIVQDSKRAIDTWGGRRKKDREKTGGKTMVQIMVFDTSSRETYQIDPGELVTAGDMDEAVGS